MSKKYPDYTKNRYTTIKIRKELADLIDQWIEAHPELKLLNLDTRSGAFQYIMNRVLIAEGFIKEPEIDLEKKG